MIGTGEATARLVIATATGIVTVDVAATGIDQGNATTGIGTGPVAVIGIAIARDTAIVDTIRLSSRPRYLSRVHAKDKEAAASPSRIRSGHSRAYIMRGGASRRVSTV